MSKEQPSGEENKKHFRIGRKKEASSKENPELIEGTLDRCRGSDPCQSRARSRPGLLISVN